jgi:membrane-associated phospholipid phosphatase
MKRHASIILVGLLTFFTPTYCESQGGDIELIADVGQVALPGAALLGAWIQKDSEGLHQLLMAFVLETGAVTILKHGVDRRRPDGGRYSFPSGHTASAFLGATFLHRRYGLKYGAPAYVAAVFVGYSRIHTKRHWTTDVLAGAAVGIGANLVFTRRKDTIVVMPVVEPGAVSCMIEFRW